MNQTFEMQVSDSELDSIKMIVLLWNLETLHPVEQGIKVGHGDLRSNSKCLYIHLPVPVHENVAAGSQVIDLY